LANNTDDKSARGVGDEITRRDFIGTTLLGAGGVLLNMPGPAVAQDLGRGWTGYGGVGDYRFSNGNTSDVVQSAHRIRDHAYDDELANVADTGELYDVVIIGAGFTGLGALQEFKRRNPNGTCLLLDNQPIFGGFAKSNEFDVHSYRIAGPQASINFLLPKTAEDRGDYWDELGLPIQFRFAQREGADPSIVFSKSTSGPLYLGEQCATVGYYFQNALTHGKGVWVKDIWNRDLQRAPWPEPFKKGLLALRDRKLQFKGDKDEAAWLDSMTFADFVTREMGLSPEVLSYITPGLCTTGPQISAAAAQALPGIGRFANGSAEAEPGDRWMSFPGGNATLLRHFVKAAFPDAIQGPNTFEAIANNPVNLSALDRPGSTCRMRLSATAVRVNHEGDPKGADHVSIVYEKGGQLYRVRAKGAVMGIGSWVTKHIVADLPNDYRAAFDEYLFGPVLMVNVALRNWRFLNKLGFSAARWFEGFGFYSTIRQPMVVGDRPTPFHPDKPVVMTFYVPIQRPNLPLIAQGPAARLELYSTPYAEYERQIIDQMQRMFASGGFNARRDVAGIVLNRWGHAFLTPPPGFYFGKDGKPSPQKILSESFGRIVFGAGTSGTSSWDGAAADGKRAITQLIQTL
jgi:spermidine dehydrogenase